MSHLLEARGLQARYGNTRVLHGIDLDVDDGKVTALVDDSNRVLPRLFESASRAGVRITSVDIREPNLETVFLQLTGKALRDV